MFLHMKNKNSDYVNWLSELYSVGFNHSTVSEVKSLGLWFNSLSTMSVQKKEKNTKTATAHI